MEKRVILLQQKIALLDKKILQRKAQIEALESFNRQTKIEVEQQVQASKKLREKERTNTQLSLNLNAKYTEKKAAWEKVNRIHYIYIYIYI